MSHKWTLLLTVAATAILVPAGLAQQWPAAAYNEGISTQSVDGNCAEGQVEPTWLEKHQANWDLVKQQADLIAQRNDAWPKPFQCYDRQAYHNVWAVATQAGWCNECTLADDHFDPETQQLNRAGKAKIAGIMYNLPTPARQILIHHTGDSADGNRRIDAVNNLLAKDFESWDSPPVAVTLRRPRGMSGSLVEDIQAKFIEFQPAPTVPRPSGETITGR